MNVAGIQQIITFALLVKCIMQFQNWGEKGKVVAESSKQMFLVLDYCLADTEPY